MKRPGVKGPDPVTGRAISNELVNHTDLMPTTCAIAGVSLPSNQVDGRSMLPYLGQNSFTSWRKSNDVGGS